MKKPNSIVDWQRFSPSVTLAGGEVQVWRACLDLPDEDLSRLLHTLSPDERSRASRYYFPRDQRRFVAARGILRNILSHYSRLRPCEILFSYEANGKPRMAGSPAAEQIRFNVSHSDNYALFAMASGADVGIDIERIQPALADGRVAESFFTPCEVTALRGLRPETRTTAFFNCWTAKEAYLKSSGEGIANGLGNFELNVSSDGLVSMAASSSAHLSLHTLVPADRFVAALVVQGQCESICFFDWDVRLLSEGLAHSGGDQHFQPDKKPNFDFSAEIESHV